MADQTRAGRSLDGTLACATCGSPGVFRVDFQSRSIVAICDDCCDRRAVACPFCDNPFGREVKRASKCKKCGETVARNSRSSVLASRLATQSVCDALGKIESDERSAVSGDWLHGCLLECLLAAAKAGRDSHAIDAAFAAALRVSFERGLTHERLQGFGFAFALAIWTCGGNPRPIQRTLHRLRLESLRAMESVEAVTVMACGDPCEKCERLNGRVLSFEEALAENPLPCRECRNTNEHGFGWCRCEYQPQLIPELLVPAQHGAAVSIEEAVKIASNGWHYVRNRGKRGLHDGCNGALDALREAGVSADTTPNHERPVFNDIVLTLKDGSRCVLMFCTQTWEYIVRRG